MKTCVLFAPGPSLTKEQTIGVRADLVGVVGNAFELCDFPDFIASTDARWWASYPQALTHPGRKFTTSRHVRGAVRVATVKSDCNSVVLTLKVARRLGAERIELYGFDMWGTHFFGPYQNGLINTPPSRRLVHQQQFHDWKAANPDIEVVNKTRGSMLEAYPWIRR